MCPRCNQIGSYNLRFNCKFGKKRVELDARVCKNCEYIWADDEEYLDVIRQHLHSMCIPNNGS